jgi:hypothetical protein
MGLRRGIRILKRWVTFCEGEAHKRMTGVSGGRGSGAAAAALLVGEEAYPRLARWAASWAIFPALLPQLKGCGRCGATPLNLGQRRWVAVGFWEGERVLGAGAARDGGRGLDADGRGSRANAFDRDGAEMLGSAMKNSSFSGRLLLRRRAGRPRYSQMRSPWAWIMVGRCN